MKSLRKAALAAAFALGLGHGGAPATAQEVTLRLHTFLPPVANPRRRAPASAGGGPRSRRAGVESSRRRGGYSRRFDRARYRVAYTPYGRPSYRPSYR